MNIVRTFYFSYMRQEGSAKWLDRPWSKLDDSKKLSNTTIPSQQLILHMSILMGNFIVLVLCSPHTRTVQKPSNTHPMHVSFQIYLRSWRTGKRSLFFAKHPCFWKMTRWDSFSQSSQSYWILSFPMVLTTTQREGEHSCVPTEHSSWEALMLEACCMLKAPHLPPLAVSWCQSHGAEARDWTEGSSCSQWHSSQAGSIFPAPPPFSLAHSKAHSLASRTPASSFLLQKLPSYTTFPSCSLEISKCGFSHSSPLFSHSSASSSCSQSIPSHIKTSLYSDTTQKKNRKSSENSEYSGCVEKMSYPTHRNHVVGTSTVKGQRHSVWTLFSRRRNKIFILLSIQLSSCPWKAVPKKS